MRHAKLKDTAGAVSKKATDTVRAANPHAGQSELASLTNFALSVMVVKRIEAAENFRKDTNYHRQYHGDCRLELGRVRQELNAFIDGIANDDCDTCHATLVELSRSILRFLDAPRRER